MIMTERKLIHGKETSEEKRSACSRAWNNAKDKLLVLGTAALMACSTQTAQDQSSGRQAQSAQPAAASVPHNAGFLQSGVWSGGQIQIQATRRAGYPIGAVIFTANVVEGSCTFNWFVYQELSPGKQYLYNPDYMGIVLSQPRYVGMVMRDATLTDGTRGDFVVEVYGNRTRPYEGGSDWDPVVERDGRVRPESVLYRVEAGTLRPVPDRMLEMHLGHEEGQVHVATETTSTVHGVVEYAPTTAIAMISANRR
jgi:hypothetical protein